MKSQTKLCQRDALLKALKRRAMTSYQIREQLGITMPATRVFELKEAGNKIKKEMVDAPSRYGSTRVAKYTLEATA